MDSKQRQVAGDQVVMATPRIQRRHIERPHGGETYCGARPLLTLVSPALTEPRCGQPVPLAQICRICAERSKAWQRAQRRAA